LEVINVMTFNEFMSQRNRPSAKPKVGDRSKQLSRPSGASIANSMKDPSVKVPILPKLNLMGPTSVTRPTEKIIPNKPHKFLPRGINLAPTNQRGMFGQFAK
jgi:hypothetical protein